jgi:hypothetical protein
MNTGRKARWAVRDCGLPAIVKPCPDCPGTHHHPTGRFRVNANGKLLDVWLLLRCAACGQTSKVPVHERVHVQSLEPARRLAYQTNDPALVHELTMSASLAAKNRYRLDWADTWELQTGTPFYSPGDPAPLTVVISFELPAPVRVERLLMLGLGLSRTQVRRMVADGHIHLPLALDAKAHQDFEVTVDGDRPPRPPPGASRSACGPMRPRSLRRPQPRRAAQARPCTQRPHQRAEPPCKARLPTCESHR